MTCVIVPVSVGVEIAPYANLDEEWEARATDSAKRGSLSQRRRHSHEDEFLYVLEGELTLIEDGGETVLRAGDCAAFPKGSGNGHHMINRSGAMAVYVEGGSAIYCRRSADSGTSVAAELLARPVM